MKTRYTTKIFIKNSEGKILLQNRKTISKNGELWGFFGGGIEKGESSLDSAIRELKEELGVDIKPDYLEIIGETDWHQMRRLDGSDIKLKATIFILKIELENYSVLEGDFGEYFTIEETKKLEINNTLFQQNIEIYEQYISRESKLLDTLPFIELMDSMKTIERHVLLRSGRMENNAEHSYHLATMAAILISNYPELDAQKVTNMCLFHDIVEIYAGDTPFIIDPQGAQTKDEREKKALIQLEATIGKHIFSQQKYIIEEYMLGTSQEALFVHQLDKIQPIIQYVLEGGYGWHKWKYEKDILINKYNEIFETDEFGLKIIVEKYFKIAEEKKLFYSSQPPKSIEK